MLWLLDAGNDETLHTLNWPASKKRQGTKSREVGHRPSSGRYADLMSAPLLMVSATRVRGDVMSAYRRTEEVRPQKSCLHQRRIRARPSTDSKVFEM